MCVCVCVHAQLLSRPALCNPMDCGPPGSSVHGIFQARILKWVAISFSISIYTCVCVCVCVCVYNGPVVNTCFVSSFILSMVKNTRNSQEAYNPIDERTNTQEVIQEQLGAENKKTFRFCCCHVLAVVNSVAMNTGVHVSFWIMIFSGYMPSSGITGSHGNSIFSF